MPALKAAMQNAPLHDRLHAMAGGDEEGTRRIDIDALVAHYAPLGRRQRRMRWFRRSATVLTVACMAAGLWTLVEPARLDGDAPARAAAAGVNPRKPVVDPSAAARAAELEALRVRLQAEAQQLDQDRLALDAQRTALEQQRRDFASERSALVARAGRSDDRARAEFAERSARFERELAALRAQRTQLESQQAALDRQRMELEALMERYAELVSRARTAPNPPEPAAAEPSAAPSAATVGGEPLLLAANRPVDDERLGEMRGGVRIGDGLDVSIGLTRSVSLNGVEQLSSAIRIDDVASAAGIDLSAVSPLVFQNGPNNAADVAALTGQVGTLVQNTLDTQLIETKTILEVSVGGISNLLQDMGAVRAVTDSLSQQP